MISVKEAKNLVRKNCEVLPSKMVNLQFAAGKTLAEDIHSEINLPSFRQSAMDGYAIRTTGDIEYKLNVVGEVKAGDTSLPSIKDGECVRIFTGAHVPDSANAVVIQEKVERIEDTITFDSEVKASMNIRSVGEQVKQGALALEKGTFLSPAAMGYLASIGASHIKVFQKPKCAIVVTGSELVEPGKELLSGQIYESNSITLKTALSEKGFDVSQIIKTKDDYQLTLNNLKEALDSSDVLIVSGGISVGDYDFVGKALLELGVKEVYYKIKQKPGKPMFFGTIGNKKVFALPGNPASALVCLYEYVMPGLFQMSGQGFQNPEKRTLPSTNNYIRRGDRSHFLKAFVHNDRVDILEGQSSFMLHTFAVANALVFVPDTVDELNSGDKVECHMI